MSPCSRWSAIRFAAFAVVGIASCWAQFSGSIQGTVKDPAGAVVPTAKVQLKNTETSVITSALSDGEGNYRFVSLAPHYAKLLDSTKQTAIMKLPSL